eukprot:2996581-Pyramimonas_sp.AAC.1
MTGAGKAAPRRAWTKCQNCQRCEYNDILASKRNLCCPGCRQKVGLYEKPSSSRRKSVQFADEDGEELQHPRGILRSPSPGR